MKHSNDLMLLAGSALLFTGSMLNVFTISGRPDGQGEATWRARFVAEYRRHPRLRGAAMACLATAAIFYVAYAVTVFG